MASARARECQTILAQFAHDFGLVQERIEETGEKRKRADVKKVQAHIMKLHNIVNKLKTTTGVDDMDALERDMSNFLKQRSQAPTADAVAPVATSSVHPPTPPARQLFSKTPETFAFTFPSHIALRYGDQFVSSEGVPFSVVGYMKQRPTFSVLAVRKEVLDAATTSAPVETVAFKLFSTMYVLRQLKRDDGSLNEANIRKFGPSVNVYDADVKAFFRMTLDGGTPVIVRVHDVAAKGKRRIKLVDVDNPRRVWSVNEHYFHSELVRL